ncbi:MAG TPA: hypothetical protein VF669_21385 [Tepidisphaeraceae bacterium]
MTANYNLDFVYKKCGFDWIPPQINRALLLNVSYDFGDRSIKLYVHDEARQFVYKIDQSRTITRQYRGDAAGAGADPRRLSEFLGDRFDDSDIPIDAVEGDVYYPLIENSSATAYIRFLDRLCLKFEVPKSQLVEVASRINRQPVANIFECCTRRAISMIKVPTRGGQPKLYSRPFLTGNGFDLPEHSQSFLCRLYDCQLSDLPNHLRFSWVFSEISTSRVGLATHPTPQQQSQPRFTLHSPAAPPG